MSGKDILIKHSEKILSDYFKDVRKDLNEKIDEIERYQKLIVRSLIENEQNNSTSINFNSLEKIVDLENRFTFMKHDS